MRQREERHVLVFIGRKAKVHTVICLAESPLCKGYLLHAHKDGSGGPFCSVGVWIILPFECPL